MLYVEMQLECITIQSYKSLLYKTALAILKFDLAKKPTWNKKCQ